MKKHKVEVTVHLDVGEAVFGKDLHGAADVLILAVLVVPGADAGVHRVQPDVGVAIVVQRALQDGSSGGNVHSSKGR